MISDSIELMYTGHGAGWFVEIYIKWSRMDHARIGTKRLLSHLRKHGIAARCTKGYYEPFAGTFDVIIATRSSDQERVNALIAPQPTPLL